jgi:hypothetical protein
MVDWEDKLEEIKNNWNGYIWEDLTEFIKERKIFIDHNIKVYLLNKKIYPLNKKIYPLTKQEYVCPHGYEESNDCPDCCH